MAPWFIKQRKYRWTDVYPCDILRPGLATAGRNYHTRFLTHQGVPRGKKMRLLARG